MHRDTILIGAGCVLAIFVGGWILLSSSAEEISDSAPAAVSFTMLKEGDTTGLITARKNYLVKNADALEELWGLMYPSSDQVSGVPEMPAIDFTTHDIIAVFDGEHTTGGFDIAVASVADSKTERALHVLHREPGDGCITAQVRSHPFEIVVLPKADLPIVRTDSTAVVECK